jgi:hypothetical protein
MSFLRRTQSKSSMANLSERLRSKWSRRCVGSSLRHRAFSFILSAALLSNIAFAQGPRKPLANGPKAPILVNKQGDHVFNNVPGDLAQVFNIAGLPVPSDVANPPSSTTGFRGLTVDSNGVSRNDPNSVNYGNAKSRAISALRNYRENPTDANRNGAQAALANMVQNGTDTLALNAYTQQLRTQRQGKQKAQQTLSATQNYFAQLQNELQHYSLSPQVVQEINRSNHLGLNGPGDPIDDGHPEDQKLLAPVRR